MELKNLIEVHLDLPRLSKDLDELGFSGRHWSVRQWTHSNMATLWDAAKGFRPVTLDDFVPPSLAALVEVIHHGKNSLPAFSHFQKRFCKPSAPEMNKDQLWGYNENWHEPFSGPGYYVAHAATDPGEVDIDYTMLPPGKVEGWPTIVPQSARLGRFIYEGMVDVMRGISSHVTIGRAKKKQGWMDAWFVLVREDPAAS
jgi:hypothetical protein